MHVQVHCVTRKKLGHSVAKTHPYVNRIIHTRVWGCTVQCGIGGADLTKATSYELRAMITQPAARSSQQYALTFRIPSCILARICKQGYSFVMEEETYFSDSTIKITSDSVKLSGKSYPIVDIASVRMRSLQADPLRELPTFLVVVGSILMFALLNLHYVFPVGWEQVTQMGAIVGMLLSVAGLVMLVLSMVLKSECIYVVHLKGTFGDACPFASDDA